MGQRALSEEQFLRHFARRGRPVVINCGPPAVHGEPSEGDCEDNVHAPTAEHTRAEGRADDCTWDRAVWSVEGLQRPLFAESPWEAGLRFTAELPLTCKLHAIRLFLIYDLFYDSEIP